MGTTREMVVIEELLDIGVVGARAVGRWPLGVEAAGPAVLTLTRVSGWATQAARLRQRGPGLLEPELATPVSVAAPAGNAAVALVPATDMVPGRAVSVGVDTAEAGLVLVRLVAVVVA